MLQFTFFKALVLKMMSFDLWPDSDFLTTCIFFIHFKKKHHSASSKLDRVFNKNSTFSWKCLIFCLSPWTVTLLWLADKRWLAISKRLFTSLGDGMYRVFIKYCVFSLCYYWTLNNDTEGNVVYSHGKIFEKDHTIFNKHPVLDYENIQFFWNTQYISKP